MQHHPGQPAWFLLIAGRLYFRQSQLPECPETPGRREPFRTKYPLAVELLREQAQIVKGRHQRLFDGGYARKSVVRPLVLPEDNSLQIEFLTRLRNVARLHASPPEGCHPNRRWGRHLPPPRQGGRWSGPWQEGEAFIDGRQRKVCWKEVVCQWRVVGHEVPVKAVVAKVEGYKKRFTLVPSATEWTGLQVVELFAARFRQEDEIRDLKQQLGWEECRAWTRNPTERTSQTQWVTMSLLRLVQFRLEAEGQDVWWTKPPWYPTKERTSVRDVERVALAAPSGDPAPSVGVAGR